jgi:RNA polymerase sigma-70 factor (ECF subfamily)
MAASASILPPINLVRIARLIQSGEPSGMEALYGIVHRGLLFFFVHHLGVSVAEDMAQDVLLAAASFVRRGKLKEPNALIGLVWITARRRLATAIRERKDEEITADDGPGMRVESDSLDRVYRHEQVEIATRVLREMPGQGREILIRFYVQEQTQEQICADMGITQDQFRLMKWRAKSRFAELGKVHLQRSVD